jgi:CRISPR/Cas system-associated endonuclease Cas3-HD
MDSKSTVGVVAVAVALICAAGWFHEHEALNDAGRTLVADTLDPITEMLKENAAITQELRGGSYAEGSDDIVTAYLTKIRRDGVPQHSDMKLRIDRLNDNNTAILALLAKYSTHAKTAAFRAFP